MRVREHGAASEIGLAGLKEAGGRMRQTWQLVAILGVACAGVAACVSEGGPQVGSVAAEQQLPEIGVSSPGRVYADKACASCHAVAAHQTRSPNPQAPPFEAIANTPGMTIMALNVWLHSPHRNMPYVLPDPDQLESLSEYLFALRGSK